MPPQKRRSIVKSSAEYTVKSTHACLRALTHAHTHAHHTHTYIHTRARACTHAASPLSAPIKAHYVSFDTHKHMTSFLFNKSNKSNRGLSD